jgi:hypothetical protein
VAQLLNAHEAGAVRIERFKRRNDGLHPDLAEFLVTKREGLKLLVRNFRIWNLPRIGLDLRNFLVRQLKAQ